MGAVSNCRVTSTGVSGTSSTFCAGLLSGNCRGTRVQKMDPVPSPESSWSNFGSSMPVLALFVGLSLFLKRAPHAPDNREAHCFTANSPKPVPSFVPWAWTNALNKRCRKAASTPGPESSTSIFSHSSGRAVGARPTTSVATSSLATAPLLAAAIAPARQSNVAQSCAGEMPVAFAWTLLIRTSTPRPCSAPGLTAAFKAFVT
mmetsp:Transcript_16488/g.43376  ORF Transcript_16488/g.43376 Transcript_16488/m.43376 type:complete len:203 (+) Transcript_16488:493-1101(+)